MKKLKLTILVLIIFLLPFLYGCAAAAIGLAISADQARIQNEKEKRILLETEFELINVEREKMGLPPIELPVKAVERKRKQVKSIWEYPKK
ncbi:hypothetical protein ES702_05963 [subsurface metagenome]